MSDTFTSENFAGNMDGGMYVGLDTVAMDIVDSYPAVSVAAEALQSDGGELAPSAA